MTTDPITLPIQTALARYEQLFTECLSHKDGMLDMALRHLAQRRGKMMRPKLMLLCARACGEIDEAVLHAAVAVELLHTASLVHDDIVDESDRRRGQKSVNALLDNKAAVLVGDYLLSTALSQAAMTGDIRINQRLAWLGQTLAEGELMQMDCTRDETVTEDAYREVIRRKTASLFAVCAELGTLLGTKDKGVGTRDKGQRTKESPAPSPLVLSPLSFVPKTSFRMGEAIGMAFQMRDDMFDYYAAPSVGKPTCGADLREGKLTLPVIHAVQADASLLPVALKARRLEASEADIALLIDAARTHGMDYTRQRMAEAAREAMDIAATCPDDVREALTAYIKLVADRDV